MNNEPGRAGVGLDNVFWLRSGVFEPSRRMFDDGFAEDFVKFGSFEFEMTSSINFGSEFKEFGDILTSFATGN